jgi:hypothetical protein
MLWIGLSAFVIASSAATFGYLLSAALMVQRRSNMCRAYQLLDSAAESFIRRRQQSQPSSFRQDADSQLKTLITALNASRLLVEADLHEYSSRPTLSHNQAFLLDIFREARLHEGESEDGQSANLDRCIRGQQKRRH